MADNTTTPVTPQATPDGAKKNPEVTNPVNKVEDTVKDYAGKIEHVAPPQSFFKRNKFVLIGAAVAVVLALGLLLATCSAKAADTGVSVHTHFSV